MRAEAEHKETRLGKVTWLINARAGKAEGFLLPGFEISSQFFVAYLGLLFIYLFFPEYIISTLRTRCVEECDKGDFIGHGYLAELQV